MILALETSCDETAAAVVTADGEIRSNVVASQAELHARYGGVVPEVASRRHLELVSPVVRESLSLAGIELDDVERVAVTQGPGLIGALLVGMAAAKAIDLYERLGFRSRGLRRGYYTDNREDALIMWKDSVARDRQ